MGVRFHRLFRIWTEGYNKRPSERSQCNETQSMYQHCKTWRYTAPGSKRSGTVQIRKRLLDFLFGQQVNVLVLSPGDSVQTVEIRELKEGGKDRD